MHQGDLLVEIDPHPYQAALRSAGERSVSLSRPFILRPVAMSLLMAAILLAGLVAYCQLPVSALPEVDYPTIQVLTFYPGASPDVIAPRSRRRWSVSSGRWPD